MKGRSDGHIMYQYLPLLHSPYSPHTWIEESVVSECEDGKHARVGGGPEQMCDVRAIVPDQVGADEESDDAQQDVGHREEVGKQTMQVGVIEEEHRLPSGMLPEQVDAGRREDEAKVADDEQEVPVDPHGRFGLETVTGDRRQRCTHRERPKHVDLDHGWLIRSFPK